MTRISIDFDGTLCKRKGIPTSDVAWGCEPMEGAVDTAWLFFENKIEFYVLTNRTEKDWPRIRKWMKKWNFPNTDEVLITNVKMKGTSVYLDDRAIRFTNWQDFRKLYF